MDKNRIVVTGMGVIAPIGIGLNKFWDSLIEGKSGVAVIKGFDTYDLPTKIAGEVKDFNPENYIEKKELKRLDRFTQFAISAAKMALEDSELDLSTIDRTCPVT